MGGLEKLVVVIPGIGGSVLARGDEPVWDAGLGDIAGLAVHPERFAAEDLRPVGLIRSKRLLPGWTVVHGYGGIEGALRRALGGDVRIDRGHPDRVDDEADVLLFPYDFRASMEAAAAELDAQVARRLSHLSDAERQGRVIVLAHSMGGLIARWWMGPMGRWRWVRGLITLGTPHRGAPKALDWLVNGVRLGPKRFTGATDLIRSWPSVYELLPRYQMVFDVDREVPCYPHDLPVDGFPQCAGAAFGRHRDIEAAWEDTVGRQVDVAPLVGWSHPTSASARWHGGRLRVSTDTPSWLGLTGWEDEAGDGTVPAISAVPIELSERASSWRRLQERHGPMADIAEGVDVVALMLRGGLGNVRGDEDAPPALGLALDEWVDENQPIPVTAELRNLDPDQGEPDGGSGPTVYATVRRAGQPARVGRIALTRVGLTTWSGELDGQPEGLYDVSVDGFDLPRVTDAVAVVAL